MTWIIYSDQFNDSINDQLINSNSTFPQVTWGWKKDQTLGLADSGCPPKRNVHYRFPKMVDFLLEKQKNTLNNTQDTRASAFRWPLEPRGSSRRWKRVVFFCVSMGRKRDRHGFFRNNKRWVNHGKMMGKWWVNHGKMMDMMGKWWVNHGKMMDHIGH